MASTDARPIPIKNSAYRVTFPILDADGDLVTGAAGLDSEVSKDAGTFADCTNEATEIATNSGMYYLDLTSTEMNADCVAVIVKTATADAKTVPIVLYPQEAGDIKVDLQSILGTVLTETAGQIAGGFKKLFDVASPVFDLLGVKQTGDAYARLGAPAGASVSADVAAIKAVLPASLVSGRIDCSVGAMAANVLTATAIAADAITDAKVASDVTIASVTGAVGSVTGNVGGNVTGTVGGLATAAKTDVENAVWNTVLSGHLTAGTTGNALNAAGSAGDPWSTTLPGAYGAGSAGKIIGDNLNATVSSRMATFSYTAPDNSSITAIKAKTDNLPTDPADQSLIISATDALATLIGDVPTNAELATALGTADDAVLTQVALVKAKTDSLTFTVAGNVDANIQYVNDVQVTGNGQTGTEWGPA